MEYTQLGEDLPNTSSVNAIDSKLPCILNGNYFRIIKQKDVTEHQKNAGGIVAICLHCIDEMKIVHGSIRVTSNFIYHLRARHPLMYEGYLREKKYYGRGRRRSAPLQSYATAAKIMKEPPNNPIEMESLTMQSESCAEGMSYHELSSASRSQEQSYNIENRDYSTDLYGTELSHSARDDQLKAINHSTENIKIIKTESFGREYLYDSTANCQTVASPSDDGNKSCSTFFTKIYTPLNNGDFQAEIDGKSPIHLPIIINGKYFRVLEINEHQDQEDYIAAVCQFCRGDKVHMIRGSVRVTSNFVRHLRSLHPHVYEEYLKDRRSNKLQCQSKQMLQTVKKCKTEQVSEDIETETYQIDGTDNESLLNDECNEGSAQQHHHNENAVNLNCDSQDSDVMQVAVPFKGSQQRQPITHRVLPTILNGTYFQIVKIHESAEPDGDGGIVALCQYCTGQYFSGTMQEINQFVQHLQCVHPEQFQRYMADELDLPQFVERVLKFIIELCLPFDVVEAPSFNHLFDSTGVQMCTAQALQIQLQCKYERFIEEFKALIQNVEYVCTTEDTWIYDGKHYLVYACHWIDADLKRQSKVLALTMLSRPPISETVIKQLRYINEQYDLNENKIICTLVDNVSDFVRTYHEFNTTNFCHEHSEYKYSVLNSIFDGHLKFYEASFETAQPNHYKYKSLTLHLLAIVDYNNALKGYDVLNYALNRCIEIMYKCKESETGVDDVLSIRLAPPVDVRWTSLYVSLACLLMHKNKLAELCAYLKVEPFEELEILHIEEFCMLLKSLVEAFDFLEECDFHYGYFLPTLITIKVKLKMLQQSGKLKYLQNAAEQMLNGLVERFRGYFEMSTDCNEAVIAAMACPSIKLRFVDTLKETAPHISYASLESLFVEHASQFYGSSDDMVPVKENVSIEDSFLCFNSKDNEEHSSGSESATYVIRGELYRYLNDKSRNISCLQRYPIVKKVFEKYNTRIACTAPVEKLLHTFLDVFKGSIPHKLSAKELERFVVIKANNCT